MKTAQAFAITIYTLVKVAGVLVFLVGLRQSWEWVKGRLDIGNSDEDSYELSDDELREMYG
jgi:hypothetical protein